jgi:hypothetical protein
MSAVGASYRPLTLGFLGDAGEIDFPIPGPGRIGVIGNHGWSPLRQSTHWKGQQNERSEPSMVEVHVVADFFEFKRPVRNCPQRDLGSAKRRNFISR